jgi:flagellar assembly protein FliH
VRVNPGDLEQIREHREELLSNGEIKNLRVVEDQRVDRGGVVVETDGGTIDARISTQVNEAKRVLHIEDEVIVQPADARESSLRAARAS